MAENYPNWMKMIIGLFVFVIIGLVLVQVLADQAEDAQTTRNANNTLTMTGNAALLGNANLRAAENCITTGTIAINGTNVTIGTNNYIVSQNCSFQMKAGMAQTSAQGSNPTNIRLYYQYLSENYIKGDSFNRTAILLIPLFIIIAILVYVAFGSGLVDRIKENF